MDQDIIWKFIPILLAVYYVECYAFIGMAWLSKIRFYQASKGKDPSSRFSLSLLTTEEFWTAGITFWFPILGKDEDLYLEKLRRKANRDTFYFLFLMLHPIVLLFLLAMTHLI